MAGKSGMTWKKEKVNKIKFSGQLTPEMYEKIMEIAAERRWSLMSTVDWLLARALADKDLERIKYHDRKN